MNNKSANSLIGDEFSIWCLKVDRKLTISLANETDITFLNKSTKSKAFSNKPRHLNIAKWQVTRH